MNTRQVSSRRHNLLSGMQNTEICGQRCIKQVLPPLVKPVKRLLPLSMLLLLHNNSNVNQQAACHVMKHMIYTDTDKDTHTNTQTHTHTHAHTNRHTHAHIMEGVHLACELQNRNCGNTLCHMMRNVVPVQLDAMLDKPVAGRLSVSTPCSSLLSCKNLLKDGL